MSIELPTNYTHLTRPQRRAVRERYITIQGGLCCHCKQPLDKEPENKRWIKTTLFPPGFFNHPVHLHHNHDTGMTIGAVHAYCNAELWQYYGE